MVDSSRPPVQRHRPIHGVLHRRTGSPGLKQIRLQSEIPLRWPVRVIDQHQARIVLQSFRLLDHGFLILPQEFLRKDPEDRLRQKKIPRRDEIDPAKIAPHWRHRRPA